MNHRNASADSIVNATRDLIAQIRRGPTHDVERLLRPMWEATSNEGERVLIAAVANACRRKR